MHQNYHFIVMLSQMLLRVSAHQRHHQGAHVILTSYLYVGVHSSSLVFSLKPVLAGTRLQSGDRYGSGMLHFRQVRRGSLPLLSPWCALQEE
jgi:hypothetical protein